MMNEGKPTSPLANKALLREAVERSGSKKEVLEYLGLRPAGGNYAALGRYADKFGIELPSYDNSDKTLKARLTNIIPDEDVFIENSTYSNNTNVKKRLIAMGMVERCAECQIGPEWNGLPLTLQLDHINGVSNDNRVDNLRFLCPNCHSQTATFAGRSQSKAKARCRCGTEIYKNSKSCIQCYSHSRRVTDWPNSEDLLELVREHGYAGTGRMLGVSDNTVRKHFLRINNY